MLYLPEYIQYDSVRGALGVSIKEIPNAAIELDIYGFFVQQELDGISATLRAEFEAINPPGVTVEDKALYDAVTVFSTYAVAYKVSDSLALSSPKTITEGKSAISRYSDSPYKSVVLEVRRMYVQYKKVLENLIAGSTTDSASTTLMSVASPTFNPVTGT